MKRPAGLAFLVLSMVLVPLAAPAWGAGTRADPLMVTPACDVEKSRITAQKLFAYADGHFRKFRPVKPIKDRVSVASLYEDGPQAEFHDAVFSTFRADFIREPNGDRVLIAFSTNSNTFRLPWGLKLGQSMQEVQSILGPPSALGSATILYEVAGETMSGVHFHFEGNRLARVAWNFGMAH